MNDEALGRRLGQIPGEDPSPEYVDQLRRRLRQPTAETGPATAASPTAPPAPTLIPLERRPTDRRRHWPVWPLAAAAALLVALVVVAQVRNNQTSDLATSPTTDARQVGERWLQSIVGNDREAFVDLHADDFVADDTLMGFSEDVALLTPTRITELYVDGFDALQAALAVDEDRIWSEGCQDLSDGQVSCAFTATMIGTDDLTYTVTAVLVVEQRLITSIDFSTTTDPADFRSAVEDFVSQEATADDLACLALGFNTVGCGQHESDFITRYRAFFEAQTN